VLPVVFDMFLFCVGSTAWRGVALLFVPELDLTLSGSSPHYSPIAYREKHCERESGDIMDQEDREREGEMLRPVSTLPGLLFCSPRPCIGSDDLKTQSFIGKCLPCI
jgi:hypothetical protein